MIRGTPKTMAEVWAHYERQLTALDPAQLARMRWMFYSGAAAYRSLLLNGYQCGKEVENFLVMNSD
jgi:hypothetical protein